jgi:hypothetical protein
MLAVEVVNGNPAERILVIAPTYLRFRDWCRDYDVNPHSPNVRYVGQMQHMRGYRDQWYVLVGLPPGMRWEDLEYMKAARGFKSAEIAVSAGG